MKTASVININVYIVMRKCCIDAQRIKKLKFLHKEYFYFSEYKESEASFNTSRILSLLREITKVWISTLNFERV